MATNTARLVLRKPDPSDNVNVTADISDNMDKIDSAVGFERWSGSYPSSPFMGKTIFRADFNDLVSFWNGTQWVEMEHRTLWNSTSVAQTWNNNTTISPVTNMSVNLKNNTAYWIEALVLYRSPTDLPNLNIGFTWPSDAFFNWTPLGLDFTVTGDSGIVRLPTHNASGNVRAIGTATGNVVVAANPKGAIFMGNTSGTVQLVAAQQNATAEATQIVAGSFIKAERL